MDLKVIFKRDLRYQMIKLKIIKLLVGKLNITSLDKIICSLIQKSVYWEKNLRKVPDSLSLINKQFNIKIREKKNNFRLRMEVNNKLHYLIDIFINDET